MQFAAHQFDQLAREHRALMLGYGRAQARCSEQLLAQGREIARLKAQVMRLRAEVILRETTLAWISEDRVALEQVIADLPRARKARAGVDAMLARSQDLVRRLDPEPQPSETGAPADAAREVDADALEASLRAADLVICQTGCVSHGAFWRVQDHCKRTGKACLLVEQPEALRIVRIHAAPDDGGQARLAALVAAHP